MVMESGCLFRAKEAGNSWKSCFCFFRTNEMGDLDRKK